MRRRSGSVTLVLVPILLAGCGIETAEDPMQRDVYTRFEDCMADWGKPELCQQMQQAEAAQFAQQTTGSAGNGAHLIFWGPSYYPGARSVAYNGQTYTPLTNKAMSRPYAVTSKSSAAARSSPGAASPAPSRGGFGAGGRAAGSSSGSSGG